jgi:hypothetical protein
MKTQSLDFRFINNDGRRVTYRAIVSDKVSPGHPVYALTVITGSPRDPGERAELERFLKGQVKAAFALGKSVKSQQVSSAYDPLAFSPRNEILFIAELITVDAAGAFELEFEIDSSIEGAPQSTSAPPDGWTFRLYDGKIRKRSQKFETAGQDLMVMRVTCSRGAVKVYSGWRWRHLRPAIASVQPPKVAHTRLTSRVTIRDKVTWRSEFTIHANVNLINPN